MDIENLLYDEIATLYEKLRDMTPGTEEHRIIVDEITKLTDRAIEMKKVDSDCEDRAATRESEQALKEQQLVEDRKDRIVRNVISAGGVILPILVTIWGTKVSLKFEETGSFTTIMGRGFINKLLPKK